MLGLLMNCYIKINITAKEKKKKIVELPVDVYVMNTSIICNERCRIELVPY
jgi:hypothetical protein